MSTEAIVASPQALLYGGRCDVPLEVAVCPECGDQLYVESRAWITKTGQPIGGSLEIRCARDAGGPGDGKSAGGRVVHRGMQDDWCAVRNRVATWANAVY